MSETSVIASIITLITGVLGGIAATVRYFRRMGSQDRRDAVKAHDQVIKHYQDMVDRMERQVKDLLEHVERQDNRISELETQVDILERDLKRERIERISGSTDVTLREVK